MPARTQLRRIALHPWFMGLGAGALAVGAHQLWGPAEQRWASGYLLWMSLANTFLPLPTNPVVIGLGRSHESALVALLGASGTCIANLTEYLLLTCLLSHRPLQRAMETRLYRALARVVRSSPFGLLLAANFLPLPIDPVRWLGISIAYPRALYALATFLGRFPRYYLLAAAGQRWQFSLTTLLLIAAAATSPALIQLLRRRLRAHKEARARPG